MSLLSTPLHDLHRELGAKLVPFAGWEMPIQYEGVIAEHLWCRSNAGLFDVSHMAVVDLHGDDPASALEQISPAGITTLAEGRQRYGLLLNDDGGVVDDFMVTNWGSHLTMVVNASRRDVDLPYLTERLTGVDVQEKPDIALLALQGPRAAEALASVVATPTGLTDETVFLDNRQATITSKGGPISVAVARSGYTGEDGFEIAVANDRADDLARSLLSHEAVRPVGLGARDTLRLEAGLCLYGNDLDETTSPVEADLVWSMPKRRREAGDFAGGARVQAELGGGVSRIRVGLQPDGKRPVRDGAALRTPSGDPAGTVSSGGFGPTIDRPVAMAYVDPSLATVGTPIIADVRGKDVACTVAATPFVGHTYKR